MSVLNENTIIGASAAGGYEIDNSLRFNNDDGAYLSRTPSTAGNRKTWTYSIHLKRGEIGGADDKILLGAGTGNSSDLRIRFTNGNTLNLLSYNGSTYDFNLTTTQLFRDPSAYMHIIIAFDTSQATASDRVKIYVNGVVVTALSASIYPNQNFQGYINSTSAHTIGKYSWTNSAYYDGYLAEVNFIDGQALTPDSFGETGIYNEWNPIEYAGTYGTNGFNLKFENASSLGNDSAGSNNWTPNNLAATDQMVDSPTNNFATLNPVDHKEFTFSEGNLKAVSSGISTTSARATMALTGNYYWEVIVIAESSSASPVAMVGIYGINTPVNVAAYSQATGYLYFGYNGTKYNNGTSTAYGTAYTVGDIIGVAFNSSTGNLVFYKNNVSQGTAYTVPTSVVYAPVLTDGSSSLTETYIANFGQDSSFAGAKTPQGNQDANGIGDFYYAPPTGFLALCTKSLPSVDVIPSENFNTVLYTGNGASRSITGVGFQPDFTWIKGRSVASNHHLVDSVRGATISLRSNATNAELTSSTGDVRSFDSDGFSLGASQNNDTNTNAYTLAAWNWKAGGSAVSNTNGTITSSVSANPSAGFSIVSYTGTGANATVGHSLSQKPELMLFKNRTTAREWQVFAESEGAGEYGVLDSTAAFAASAIWQNTLPTSSVFSIGNFSGVNTNAENYIAYCFHSVDGYSKVGSYTGNGSADGTFVHCGFRPAYVMVKQSSSAGNSWMIYDTERSTFNVIENTLRANTSDAENTSTGSGGYGVDTVSNGFKVRTTWGGVNASGSTYIFLAFAESPFKHTNAR